MGVRSTEVRITYLTYAGVEHTANVGNDSSARSIQVHNRVTVKGRENHSIKVRKVHLAAVRLSRSQSLI